MNRVETTTPTTTTMLEPPPLPRKQVRFESPLISSCRKISAIPSPPPTPPLYERAPIVTISHSKVRSSDNGQQQQCNIWRSRLVHHQRIVLTRSLPCSPQRHASKEKRKNGQPQQQSLPFRMLNTILLRHSRSNDSLQSAASKAATNTKCPSPSNDASGRSANSPFPLPLSLQSTLCQIWEAQEREEQQKWMRAEQRQQQPFSAAVGQQYGPLGIGLAAHRANYARGWEGVPCGQPPLAGPTPPLRRPLATAAAALFRRGGVNSRRPAAEEEEEKAIDDEDEYPFSRSFGPPLLRPLPSSQSFPPPNMTTSSGGPHRQHTFQELEEFDDDFVPRSSSTARQNRLHSMDSQANERVQIRRMSLKEFSGLDIEEHMNQRTAGNQNGGSGIGPVGSPLLNPWKGGSQALGSLIDKFSTRRRSASSVAMKISHGTGDHQPGGSHQQQECPHNSFDRAIEGISQAIQDVTGGDEKMLEKEVEADRQLREEQRKDQQQRAGFGQTSQRLTNIRNHLNSTLQAVPNVSPRKAQSIERERLVLLNESRVLVAACKDMVRMATPPPLSSSPGEAQPPDCLPFVQSAVDSADRMAQSVEGLIRKSHSIFQAQQLTTNADQLLKTLADTVREVEKCQKAHQPRSLELGRELVRCSTQLAATLVQFTQLIRNLN